MTPILTEQLDRHSVWRAHTADRLSQLAQWLTQNELSNGPLATRLEQIAAGLLRDKVMVAFVAEFSRGKSELINAIFFAHYGRRIVPASAGRTTMCPTELGFDAGVPPSLRLLPIETRLEARSMSAWRAAPDAWTRMPLDVADAQQMARALETVAQVRRVSQAAARALGFWNDETPDDNPPQGEDGLVEVPMWRHAIVNIDHPLLRQGLVVLDTPGLNAIGAEPELTVQLLAEAHATVFLLAADAGVTRSDLGLWREHLAPTGREAAGADSRIVVLNKIDVLWDGISSAQQVQAQTERQRAASASLLGLPAARVIPVSAQRGLLARISGNAGLLQASGLPLLESVLGQGIVERRQSILRDAVAAGVSRAQAEAGRLLTMRRREIDEQSLELRSLRGKNATVIAGMRARVEQEQQEFDASEKRAQALHAVHKRLLRDAHAQLTEAVPAPEFVELQRVLTQPGFRLGAKRAYQAAFALAEGRLDNAQDHLTEMHAMLDASFRQLNADFGFSLQLAPAPDIGRRALEVAEIGQVYAHHVGVANLVRLSQATFAGRLVRALASRVQDVLADASVEVESWSRSALSPVNTQLRERRQSFVRRIEAIDRIQQAASGLGERMVELDAQAQSLAALAQQLREWGDSFAKGGEPTQPATALNYCAEATAQA